MKKIVISLVMLSLFSMLNIFAQSNDLLSGETIEGTLTEDILTMEYPFTGNEGDRLTISVSSSQFDSLLNVIDSEGQIMVSNDDANGSLNSQIDAFILPAAGDYTLVVTSSDGTETGDYELLFKQTQVQTLKYGDSVAGSINETTAKMLFQFDGKLGDVVTIQMKSSEIDSYLALSNSEYEIISDDDSGGALNAMIGAFTLPATDTYTISAYTNAYESYGDFTISIDKIEASPIEVNQTISGTLANEPLYYSFMSEGNEIISVRVVSDDGLLDTMLNIQGPYGYSLSFDDDGGYINDPEINNLFLYDKGQYIVTVIPAQPDSVGNFKLSVIKTPNIVLECDSSESLQFNQKVSQVILTMDVKAKQDVTFTYYGETSHLGALYSNYQIGSEYLPVDFITDVDGETSIDIKSPVTGQLNIQVSDYAFRWHSFRLDITCS